MFDLFAMKVVFNCLVPDMIILVTGASRFREIN